MKVITCFKLNDKRLTAKTPPHPLKTPVHKTKQQEKIKPQAQILNMNEAKLKIFKSSSFDRHFVKHVYVSEETRLFHDKFSVSQL